LAVEELNGPLIDQVFGGELFSRAQLRERAVELERRDAGVWISDQQLRVTATEK